MLSILLTEIAEIIDVIASFFRRLVRWRLTVEAKPGRQLLTFDRYLVLCVYDLTPRPDLLALIRQFKTAGFGIVLATSNDAYRQYQSLADAIVRVAPVGRDFTAYKEGYRYLAGGGRRPGAVVFANDSVWYFAKYQEDIVARIDAGLGRGALVAGTMVLDYVPHVSGWLFGLPWNDATDAELAALFQPNFARRSRAHHIRNGEHKILQTLRSTADVVSLDAESPVPAIAYGYHAIMLGAECFYVKADAILRTNPVGAHLTEFIALNAEEGERKAVLRWLASQSDRLLDGRLRRRELQLYSERYFPGTTPAPTRRRSVQPAPVP